MTTLTIIALITLAGWGWAKSYIRGLAIRKMHYYAEQAELAVQATLDMRDKQYSHIYKRFEEVSEELEAANEAVTAKEELLESKDMLLRTYKIERNQYKEDFTRKDKVFYELLNSARNTSHALGREMNMQNVGEYIDSIERGLANYTDRYEGRKNK